MSDDADGYGQSWLDDLRSAWRFRAYRERPTRWSRDTALAANVIAIQPIVERFGDSVAGVAKVGARWWIVMENIWHGWPDPPQFAFFEIEDGAILVGKGFDYWPAAWTFED